MMDSRSRYGAVMALPDTRNPISVARTVMEKCIHNVLVGDGALEWAKAQVRFGSSLGGPISLSLGG